MEQQFRIFIEGRSKPVPMMASSTGGLDEDYVELLAKADGTIEEDAVVLKIEEIKA